MTTGPLGVCGKNCGPPWPGWAKLAPGTYWPHSWHVTTVPSGAGRGGRARPPVGGREERAAQREEGGPHHAIDGHALAIRRDEFCPRQCHGNARADIGRGPGEHHGDIRKERDA